VRRSERVLLGLRLDEPLSLDGLSGTVDAEALERLEGLGLVRRADDGGALALTERGRFLGGGVTAALLA
jgi:coproporphyrinogen III oxidase-like Fe-S oxidoreductase